MATALCEALVGADDLDDAIDGPLGFGDGKQWVVVVEATPNVEFGMDAGRVYAVVEEARIGIEDLARAHEHDGIAQHAHFAIDRAHAVVVGIEVLRPGQAQLLETLHSQDGIGLLIGDDVGIAQGGVHPR